MVYWREVGYIRGLYVNLKTHERVIAAVKIYVDRLNLDKTIYICVDAIERF